MIKLIFKKHLIMTDLEIISEINKKDNEISLILDKLSKINQLNFFN